MMINEWLSKNWLVLVASIFVLPQNSIAQDWSKLREEFQDSLVFLESIRSKNDGTGIPERQTGTGFIISNEGHVITTKHVVFSETSDTSVITYGSLRSRYSQKYPLTLTVPEDRLDLAVLQFPNVGVNWKPVQFGDSAKTPEDAALYVLGYPGAADLTSGTGILSSKYGIVGGRWRTTLPLNRGNSGGPVFSIARKVVAIAAAGDDAQQLVTYAIPESFTRGVRILIASFNQPSMSETILEIPEIKAGASPPKSLIQHFSFYKSADNQNSKIETQLFCLPENYRITNIDTIATWKAGIGTGLKSLKPDRVKTNCARLEGLVAGSGQRKIGPIVVEDYGIGWLGVGMSVTGERISKQ